MGARPSASPNGILACSSTIAYDVFHGRISPRHAHSDCANHDHANYNYARHDHTEQDDYRHCEEDVYEEEIQEEEHQKEKRLLLMMLRVSLSAQLARLKHNGRCLQ